MIDKIGHHFDHPVPKDRMIVPVLTGDQIVELTPAEHNARAMVINMFYDKYTNTYRFKSPEGSNYSYSGSLDADTLEELPRGVTRQREKDHFKHSGKGNTVSNKRLGI